MDKNTIDFYTRLAHGLAAQFGSNCEIVVHDLESNDVEHSIVAIENGYISGRQLGDGPSHIVLESLQNGEKHTEDKLAYLTKTKVGKILKSSTIYIRNPKGKITGILSINYDITILLAAQTHIQSLTATASNDSEDSGPETVSMNVTDLLDELIDQAFKRIGKPAAVMTKDDKVQFIRLLNDAGAFLITKSGQRVCQILCISKFTLYSYLNEIKAEEEASDSSKTKAEQDS